MEQLLKEINDVLNASEQETPLVAVAFLHGMRTALALGLNKDGEKVK